MRQPEAARHLGISVSSLRRYHHQGLPVSRVLGVCLYLQSELEAWVNEQSTGPV